MRTRGPDPASSLHYCGTPLDLDEIAGRAAFFLRVIGEERVEVVDRVIGVFGSMTARQLSNLTHESGTLRARCYKKDDLHAVVPSGIIRKHYLKQVGNGV